MKKILQVIVKCMMLPPELVTRWKTNLYGIYFLELDWYCDFYHWNWLVWNFHLQICDRVMLFCDTILWLENESTLLV